MAWTYLAASEDSQLPWRIGCGRSPIVKTIDTHNPFYCPVYRRVDSPTLPSGTTCERFVLGCSRTPSTSFMEDSPARMSALQALVKAWTASAPAYSVKQFDLFENVDLSSYSSKMCQESEDMCLASGASLRRLATIAGMAFFPPAKLAHYIQETVGSYLPTPMSHQGGSNRGTDQERRKMLPSLATNGKLWRHDKGPLHPRYVDRLMGYPYDWTASQPWAMQWFRSKPAKPSKDSEA